MFIKIIIITQASFDQLADPRTLDAVVERFFVSFNNIIIICIITIIINISITIIITSIIIANRFLASDFCSNYADERCPEFLEAVLRQGIPALVQSSNPDEYPQVLNKSKSVFKVFLNLNSFPVLQFCCSWDLPWEPKALLKIVS